MWKSWADQRLPHADEDQNPNQAAHDLQDDHPESSPWIQAESPDNRTFRSAGKQSNTRIDVRHPPETAAINAVMSVLSRRIARSRIASVAAIPGRASLVGRYNAAVLHNSARWLLRSREHTNFTYNLTPLSREHLIWFIATVADRPVAEIRAYFEEVESDHRLIGHIQNATAASDRRRLADSDVRFGRRVGWYALIRALRPAHVVETGTDKGLGSCVFAAAVLRNGGGRVTTIDVNPDSGYLISGEYETVIDRRIGDSLRVLGRLDDVSVFLHDSLHTRDHENAELAAVGPRLTEQAVILSDNAHCTDALSSWAEQTGRRFLFFREQPHDHWYPGAGIGAAWFGTNGAGRCSNLAGEGFRSTSGSVRSSGPRGSWTWAEMSTSARDAPRPGS
jgi:predicted O-methyltransferase YrrM